MIAVGRDLRAIAAIQQRFLDAQQDLERGYWKARQVESQERQLYQVLNDGVMTVDAPLHIGLRQGGERHVQVNANGKPSLSHFKALERRGGHSYCEVRIETGRTHQVRVHCASIGHPLLGDPVYGRNPQRLRPILTQLHFARQALHAAELGFIHPVTGAAHRFTAALPAAMTGLLVELER